MLDKYPSSIPTHITDQVRRFARELTHGESICRVPIRPQPFAKPLQCYLNSFLTTQFDGGNLVVGYSLWTTNDLFLTAEHHCIVRQADGTLTDPTPDWGGASRVLFAVMDEVADVDALEHLVRRNQSGAYRVLVDHPHIRRAVDVLDAASHQMWLRNNEAMQQGVSECDADRQLCLDAVDEVELWIDRYYQEQTPKVECRLRDLRRMRRKRERRARKRNRQR